MNQPLTTTIVFNGIPQRLTALCDILGITRQGYHKAVTRGDHEAIINWFQAKDFKITINNGILTIEKWPPTKEVSRKTR